MQEAKGNFNSCSDQSYVLDGLTDQISRPLPSLSWLPVVHEDGTGRNNDDDDDGDATHNNTV